jgi:predicted metalloprotease with PDZ domain
MRFQVFILFILTSFNFSFNLYSQSVVKYNLEFDSSEDYVSIFIELPQLVSATELTIPRSAPGTYELTHYDVFYSNVLALTISDQRIEGVKGDGSFFTFKSNKKNISSISYKVDIRKMESELYGSFASSKKRQNYLGLLGYSIFGVVTEFQDYPIELTINTDSDWPIFSTLEPTRHPPKESASFNLGNYGALADAQYLLGKGVQLWSSSEANIPLFVAVYSETEIDIEEIGRRALISLKGLNDYYGFTPMPFYTVCYEFLNPLSQLHDYGFSMEHLNSMTASQPVSNAIQKFEENPKIGSMVHHMGHSWVPLRSYGKGYRPFNWATAPIIETIWLNEGFTWFVAYHEVLKDTSIINWFNSIMDQAPEYIQEMSLKDLSVLGSTQYSADFRIGKNLFARGALLAYEIDQKIRSDSNEQRSFKSAINGLYKWSDEHKRAFEYDEIINILSSSSQTDLKVIWEKWQQPPKRNH